MNQPQAKVQGDDDTDLFFLLHQMYAMVQELHESSDRMEDRLWTLEDVAAYLQTSVQTARRIMKQKGAPAPIHMPTRGDHATPSRWYGDEVKAYIKRKGR